MPHDPQNLPTEELDKLLRAALGTRESSHVYYDQFKRYLSSGIPFFSFDAWGFVFGFLWFCYRKIWPPLVPAFLFLIGIQLFGNDAGVPLLAYWLAVGSVLGGFFGRQIYFWWVLTFIRSGMERGLTGSDLEHLVRKDLGTISDSVRLRQ